MDLVGGLVGEEDARRWGVDTESPHLVEDHDNDAAQIARVSHVHGGGTHPFHSQLTLDSGHIDPCRLLAFGLELIYELLLGFPLVLSFMQFLQGRRSARSFGTSK